MKNKLVSIDLMILIVVTAFLNMSFVFYFRSYVPRFYLVLSLLPVLLSAAQLSKVKAMEFSERTIFDIYFIKFYPFIGGGLS
ncbi:MAG TPA: hypothetical protein ENN77_01990, partial [Candidatus Wirthbacteria bacterium]|nr:hypothetical protein [Candidatus Wirthbacteria bacterium]